MRRTEYLILFGLDETATADDIRRAYLRRAKPLHPDVNSTPEAHDAFRILTEAYQALRQATPRHPPVPVVPPPPEKTPPPPTPPPSAHVPRAARARWAGATAFSISIVGALIAFNAGVWPDDPAPRESGVKASNTEVSSSKASNARPPISPALRADAPATKVSPELPKIPPILMGRSTRHEAKPATPPQPLAAVDPSPPRVALVKPTQDGPSRPAQAVPVAPKPFVPGQMRPIVGRPTIPAQASPVRAAPVFKRVAPFARSTSAKVRPRERALLRNGPAGAQAGAATVSPHAQPRAPQPSAIESLAGVNLNRLLRSVLQ